MKQTKQITNIPELRKSNISALLSIVWKEKEVTRADLSLKTSLTPNTVSSIVNDLLKEGIFTKAGKKDSTGGRQPDVIRMNSTCRYSIGVSIGVNQTSAVITDLYGQPVRESSVPVSNQKDREDILTRTFSIVDSLLEDFPYNTSILGIGVSFPGSINHVTGEVLDSSILGSSVGLNLKLNLQEQFEYPVFVENNVNLCALNEAFIGVGQGKQIVLFVYAGYGIGSGLTINGNIYEGARDSAGNLGHNVIEPNGKLCYCGSYGCLETVASYPALFDDYVSKIKMSGSRTPGVFTPESFSLQAVDSIFSAARHEESQALNALQTVGQYIGIATANLIGILNPDLVVFGGEYSEVADILLPVIQDSVRSRTWITIKDTKLSFSGYGQRSDLYGASSMVIKAFLGNGDTL